MESAPAAYPPGATSEGGVLPGDGGAGDSGTIRRARLAQTGDALAALAGAALAAALAAGAALLAARRRSRA